MNRLTLALMDEFEKGFGSADCGDLVEGTKNIVRKIKSDIGTWQKHQTVGEFEKGYQEALDDVINYLDGEEPAS